MELAERQRGISESRKPSSPPPDLIDFSFPPPPAAEETDAAAGADIFLLGRLLPYEFPQPTLLPHLALQRADMEKPRPQPFIHRRADSLDEHDCRRRGEVQTIDYQQLRRASSDPRPAPAAVARRRWPLLVLGSLKFPAEMEISDIRNRQMRRGPPVVVSEVVEHGRRKCHWSILRALSCKAAENTAVVPPGATGRTAGSSCLPKLLSPHN